MDSEGMHSKSGTPWVVTDPLPPNQDNPRWDDKNWSVKGRPRGAQVPALQYTPAQWIVPCWSVRNSVAPSFSINLRTTSWGCPYRFSRPQEIATTLGGT